MNNLFAELVHGLLKKRSEGKPHTLTPVLVPVLFLLSILAVQAGKPGRRFPKTPLNIAVSPVADTRLSGGVLTFTQTVTHAINLVNDPPVAVDDSAPTMY